MEFLSILFGGGIVTLVQFLIKRHDDKQDRKAGIMQAISALTDQVQQIKAELLEQAAISARVRILKFADEMQEGRRHSKDSWDQAMSDITAYEKHCYAHPDFKNGQTAATVDYIKRGYAERLEKHDFL